uniref:Uncharacterized protein n=1 Tax=Anguilla anguilla TaxID=7936 RepID=A0A0E9Q6V8_ANGAN
MWFLEYVKHNHAFITLPGSVSLTCPLSSIYRQLLVQNSNVSYLSYLFT